MKNNSTKLTIFRPPNRLNRPQSENHFMKTKARLIRSSMGRSPWQRSLFLSALVLVAFALSPMAQAQLSPPPDGGYANNNTAEGTDALFSLTTGPDNTGIGFDALFNNTTGDSNTAAGNNAVLNNTTGTGNIGLGDSAGSNLTTGDNNIDIGNPAVSGEAGIIRIGTANVQTATFIAGIDSATVPKGMHVVVDANG